METAPRRWRPYVVTAASACAAVALTLVVIVRDDPTPGVDSPPTGLATQSSIPTPAPDEVTSRFFPAETGRIGEGESFRSDLDGSGGLDTVALVGTEQGADVVFVLNNGAERSLSLSGGSDYAIYRTRPDVSGSFQGVLVEHRPEGEPGRTTLGVVMVVDGQPTRLEVVGRLPRENFGSRARPADAAYETWISPDGGLFTRVPRLDVGPGRKQLFRWAMTDQLFGASDRDGNDRFGLTASRVGRTYCFDEATEPPTVTACR